VEDVMPRLNSAARQWLTALILALPCVVFGQARSEKPSVPSEAAQAEAMKIAKEIYGKQYAEAKTIEQKKSLSEQFLKLAAESKDDPASHFALLRLARDVAALAGESGLALLAIDAMAMTFDIDTVSMKVETLLKAASCATSSEQHAQVIEFTEQLRNNAVERDDFATAVRLGDAALAAAKKTGDRTLVRKLQDRAKEIRDLAQAFAEVQQAAASLENRLTDPAANLTFGKYLCFRKGQWERGLPMLSRGDDPQLRELALQELAVPSSADAQKQLGDRWWELAEKADEAAKNQIQERALRWYRQALPGLTGLAKDVVEKRLAASTPRGVHPPGAAPTTPVGTLSPRMMQHNRQVAEWVLRMGGHVEIQLQDQGSETEVNSLPDLPKAVFVVTNIDLKDRAGVSDRDLAGLVGLRHLRQLNVAGTKVSDAGMAYVAGLTSLEELYLGGTQVGDSGLRSVGNLTDLTFLGLFYTKVTDNGLRYLDRLQKLQRINLGGTKTSDAMLRSVLPKCAIERPK
jgi:TPR repeat protein